MKICLQSNGRRLNANLYRPVHEIHQIDISATVRRALGEEVLPDMAALVQLR